MKIIFSRKGFDSKSGRRPSPIIDGVPISLPIPLDRGSETTYADLGLAEIVEATTKGRITGQNMCHHDPMFENGRCAFGQVDAAQGHLAKNGVGIGDVFLFFGLFADMGERNRHHRFFGYMTVEETIHLGKQPEPGSQPQGFSRRHPHTRGTWGNNNTLYIGPGDMARTAHDMLRLSRPELGLCYWRVPAWLQSAGLTYHSKAARWQGVDTLNVVGRGQEFVCDIGDREDAHQWLDGILTALKSA
ncbi:hypothetical protein [Roseospira navarrensis]|uniref:Nucleotide modification associated domain-containing protein n=1 Tax=Roseospira navarrensis TaxID=140058 RepID=A0A7X1ZDD3_9PROT|nr:hypothetical protein [Roseospira navarrensis]MQX36493.1 hypothetical protein [Roseospira navarrensis]